MSTDEPKNRKRLSMNDAQKEQARKLFEQADALYRSGEFLPSLALLEQLERSHPENKNVLYAKALCLEGLGRIQGALELCDRLADLYSMDKAVILKARLITLPESPAPTDTPFQISPAAAISSGKNPDSNDALKKRVQALTSLLAVLALLLLLPRILLSYAQSDAALVNTPPELYPGRLLVICCMTVLATSTAALWAFFSIHPSGRSLSGIRNFGFSLLAALCALVPLAGWTGTGILLHLKRDMTIPLACAIVVLVIGLQALLLAITGATLDITTFNDIYEELRAGYG